jgi:hypothetical protein
MSDPAIYFSDAERQERHALLQRLGVSFAKPDAKVVALEERRRRPLGLRPAPGDDGPEPSEEPDSAGRGEPYKGLLAAVDAETRAMPASVGYTLQHIDIIAEAMLDAHNETVDTINWLQDRLKSKFDALENTIGALKNENQSLRLILENLRITQRGERGVDGDRGPPGRDGRDGVGQIGPQGPQCERGPPAAMIAAWSRALNSFNLFPRSWMGREACR